MSSAVESFKGAVWTKGVFAGYNGTQVLEDINLKLNKGQLIAVLGPNGAGKTTLFKLFIGIKRPLLGEILVLGKPVEYQRRSSEIAYVPQEEEIDWNYPISVWDVVLTGRYGRIRNEGGIKKFLPPRFIPKHHKDIVYNALDAVKMMPFKDKPIGALSGGQKKRVFIARALAQDARILLLDEPFVGIDDSSKALILDLLKSSREGGKTVLMITHDLLGVREYADMIVLLNKTVISSGPPGEVSI